MHFLIEIVKRAYALPALPAENASHNGCANVGNSCILNLCASGCKLHFLRRCQPCHLCWISVSHKQNMARSCFFFSRQDWFHMSVRWFVQTDPEKSIHQTKNVRITTNDWTGSHIWQTVARIAACFPTYKAVMWQIWINGIFSSCSSSLSADVVVQIMVSPPPQERGGN